ncbi:hypothetical protein FQN57_002736 [Myotisia sp. PD_48]|nr:hypothetical protein FQN57_002736 [Myotisia sp. PD_48]
MSSWSTAIASAHSTTNFLATAAAATLVATNPTNTMLPTSTATPQEPGDDSSGKCELLGPFALIIQAALGGLALLVLVYKRWRERPQRPVKVWAFDVSKQVFGSVLLHLANLLASMFSAGQIPVTAAYEPNPCSYYLLNLGIDTTLGIPILILILRVLNYAARYTPLANPPESIESGNYGQPPKLTWWFKQSIIYFGGLVCMKTGVIFVIHTLPFIVEVGDWALRWTEGNAAVQIFFVMLLFPVVMNGLQYYIIDVVIKKAPPANEDSMQDGHSIDTTSIDGEANHRTALLSGLDSGDDDYHRDDAVPIILSDDESVAKLSMESSRRANNSRG